MFGIDDGSKNAVYWSQHARVGMVNVISKRFAHQGCIKKSSYGVDDRTRKAEYNRRPAGKNRKKRGAREEKATARYTCFVNLAVRGTPRS